LEEFYEEIIHREEDGPTRQKIIGSTLPKEGKKRTIVHTDLSTISNHWDDLVKHAEKKTEEKNTPAKQLFPPSRPPLLYSKNCDDKSLFVGELLLSFLKCKDDLTPDNFEPEWPAKIKRTQMNTIMRFFMTQLRSINQVEVRSFNLSNIGEMLLLCGTTYLLKGPVKTYPPYLLHTVLAQNDKWGGEVSDADKWEWTKECAQCWCIPEDVWKDEDRFEHLKCLSPAIKAESDVRANLFPAWDAMRAFKIKRPFYTGVKDGPGLHIVHVLILKTFFPHWSELRDLSSNDEAVILKQGLIEPPLPFREKCSGSTEDCTALPPDPEEYELPSPDPDECELALNEQNESINPGKVTVARYHGNRSGVTATPVNRPPSPPIPTQVRSVRQSSSDEESSCEDDGHLYARFGCPSS
jgi:hypothetical protein